MREPHCRQQVQPARGACALAVETNINDKMAIKNVNGGRLSSILEAMDIIPGEFVAAARNQTGEQGIRLACTGAVTS